MWDDYLGQYSINKLLINHKPRKTTIGDKSSPPKEGKYLLTKFKLGSHNRYNPSRMVYTKRLLVLIILKVTSQVRII